MRKDRNQELQESVSVSGGKANGWCSRSSIVVVDPRLGRARLRPTPGLRQNA
jgi:hypothetical protein